jgi:hypothetical protein
MDPEQLEFNFGKPDRTLADFVPSKKDPVNHPGHYTSHPSGVECIQITEHMGFNLGNALKYIWRADLKNDAIEDMNKAVFYLNREIALRVEQTLEEQCHS